jgi:ABC-2 type transport system ATP-binding protein
MRYAIEADALRKSFGGVLVLDGVQIAVPAGSVFALLGPNGAGKTTTVRILATLIQADAGKARVAGFDVVAQRRQVRRALSLTGQYAAVDELQTGEENLRMMGRLRGLGRVAAKRGAGELLERFDLGAAAAARVNTYSGGMRRRLDLAASLVGDPVVVFLDEPTTGLDLRSRQAMWELVVETVDRGVTILLTTQYLDEADRLADRIGMLDAGRIVAEGTAGELKRRVAGQRLELTVRDRGEFTRLAAVLGTRATHADPAKLTFALATDGTAEQVRAALDELDPDRSAITSFAVHDASLDDVFLQLTGRGADDGARRTGNV